MQQTIARVEVGQLRRRARIVLRILISLAVILPTLYICCRYALSAAFSIFMNYDDEGVMLIALDQLAKGHILYDQVVSMYGPVGILPKLMLVRIFGMPITHDMGRFFMLGCWLTSSAELGVVAWRLGRSVAWFAVGAVAACLSLYSLAKEPGHPQEICMVLITTAVVAGTFTWPRRISPAIFGILGGLLVMTKINLGIFYLAGLGAALIFDLSPGRLRSGLICTMFASVAMPFVLMHGDLARHWAFCYAAQTSLAIFSCLLVATLAPADRTSRADQMLLLAGYFTLTVVLIGVITVAVGTSFHGLIDGVILMPLRQSHSWEMATTSSSTSLETAALGLLLAALAAWWGCGLRQTQNRSFVIIIGLVRVAASLFILNRIIDAKNDFGLNSMPGFAWLILLPVRRRPDAERRLFARLLLAFVAIFESMWAYPVAGNQVSFSIVLLIVVAIVTLADGIADLASQFRRSAIGSGLRIAATGVILFMSLRLGWLSAVVGSQFHEYYVPLDLPGARLIRLAPEDAQAYRLVTANLRRNTDMFYTFPGRNSFYLWTQLPPPTPANITGAMRILTDEQEQQIIDVMDKHPSAILLNNRKANPGWNHYNPLPRKPLLDYFKTNFRLAFLIGQEEFWVRKDRLSMVEVYPDGSEHLLKLSPPTTESSESD